MILQPIKHASLLPMATVGLMGCLYLSPKSPLSAYTSCCCYLSGPDGKLYTSRSQISPHSATQLKKVWSYPAADSCKVGWTTMYCHCMQE